MAGSADWVRNRRTSATTLKDIARDLIAIYAARKKASGHRFNLGRDLLFLRQQFADFGFLFLHELEELVLPGAHVVFEASGSGHQSIIRRRQRWAGALSRRPQPDVGVVLQGLANRALDLAQGERLGARRLAQRLRQRRDLDGDRMRVCDTVAICVDRSSRVGKPGTSVPRTDTGLTLWPPE